MIQRIQTVYLLISTVLLSIGFFYGVSDFARLFKDATSSSVFFAVLILIAALMTVVSIFLYKKRMLQAKMVGFAQIFVLLGYLCVVVVFCTHDFQSISLKDIDLLYPLLAAFFNLLARKAIYRDENMVRAADRIR